jgi:hypothetical protein
MPLFSADCRGQAPQPRSGASKTPGLRSAIGGEIIRSAVVCQSVGHGPPDQVPTAANTSIVRSTNDKSSRGKLPINIGERSGQLRPYVRPVARRSPLAIMGVRLRDRGRDAGHPAPPAQIRTGPIKASGSYLGCLAANRTLGHGWRILGLGRKSLASFFIRSHRVPSF